jgi:hypothetical protein
MLSEPHATSLVVYTILRRGRRTPEYPWRTHQGEMRIPFWSVGYVGWGFELLFGHRLARGLLLGIVQSVDHVNRDEIFSLLGLRIPNIGRYKMRCLQ